MSLLQSIFYKCKVCKQKFRYDNRCRCKMCGRIDALVCLSCHNVAHQKGLLALATMYFILCANSLIQVVI